MARPNLKKRSRKTPASKTTSKVTKPSVSRVTRRVILQRAAIAHNSVNSPLLRLPAEIRNQIYEDVIGGQTYVVRKRTHRKPHYHLTRNDSIGINWREQTALPRTCRQFRYDTSVLIFQNNIFMTKFSEPSSTMNGWMHSLQPYHASAIQTVFWGLCGIRGDPEALKLLLADWMNIKRVGIYGCIGSRLHDVNQEALKITGFELDQTAGNGRIGLSIMWYDRS